MLLVPMKGISWAKPPSATSPRLRALAQQQRWRCARADGGRRVVSRSALRRRLPILPLWLLSERAAATCRSSCIRIVVLVYMVQRFTLPCVSWDTRAAPSQAFTDTCHQFCCTRSTYPTAPSLKWLLLLSVFVVICSFLLNHHPLTFAMPFIV